MKQSIMMTKQLMSFWTGRRKVLNKKRTGRMSTCHHSRLPVMSPRKERM